MSDAERQVQEDRLQQSPALQEHLPRGAQDRLQQSSALQELLPRSIQDPAGDHGGQQLFIRVEGAPPPAGEAPASAAVREPRAPGPRPTAPTPDSGPHETRSRRRGFTFSCCRSGHEDRSRAFQENGDVLPRALPSSLPNVEDDESSPTRLFQPAFSPAPRTQGDPGRVSRLNQDNTQDLQDLSPIYCILKASEKGVGDFTSITFEIEELTEVEEECTDLPGDLSHPETQGRSLKEQFLRPHTREGRTPTADGKILLATPTLRRAHLLPPLKEYRAPVRDALRVQDLESWMSSLPPALKRIPLNHLYIPGSHDSFSSSLVAREEVGPDVPGLVARLASCCPCLARKAILRWSVTQRATPTHQLHHGVRYFDIRVAVRGSRFYFVHGLFGSDLEPLLSQVRQWLVQHRGEVVLLDFQHFHGLEPEDHASLVALLEATFTHTICPVYSHLPHLSLAYLSRSSYQVLVFYRHLETRRSVSWLWSGDWLPNPWPAATSAPQMLRFLEDRLQTRDPRTFFVTQCVLTPTGNYLAKNLCGKLEWSLAAPTNRVLPAWLEGLPAGPPGANVVMTDFVDHDDWAVPRAVVSKNLASLLTDDHLIRY